MNTLTSAPGAAPQGPRKSDDITDVEDLSPKTDTQSPIRLGFWVLVVGFGLFLAWAAWAPLDEGVSAPATVSIETRRKTIQHMSGGVLKQVVVKEGQMVKAGDVLVELDDAATRAGYESIRQNYLSQRALESRLMAETLDSRSITFHPDLLDKKDLIAAQYIAVQQQVFQSRRAAQEAEIGAAQQSIAGLEGQITGMQQMLANRREQAALQATQLGNAQSLAKDGYLPRNQALQMEQSQAELRASLADMEANIQRTRSAIAETRLRIAQRKQEYIKEVSSQLADVRREVQANQERLVAIRGELERTQIKSPVDGQVVALQGISVGGVAAPGQRLMDIVPKGETLLLDAKVTPAVIDRVRAGDLAEVRFSGFANTPQLVVQGKVLTLSSDAVQESGPAGVNSFYLARVEITPEGLKVMGNRALQPGMQAEVLIKTGERSLLTYLLHPLTKRVASAMTEE